MIPDAAKFPAKQLISVSSTNSKSVIYFRYIDDTLPLSMWRGGKKDGRTDGETTKRAVALRFFAMDAGSVTF